MPDTDTMPDNRPGEKCINCNHPWDNHGSWCCTRKPGHPNVYDRSKLPRDYQYLVPSMLPAATLKEAKLDDRVLVYLTDSGAISTSKTNKTAEAIVVGVDGQPGYAGTLQVAIVDPSSVKDANYEPVMRRRYGNFGTYSKDASKYLSFGSLVFATECLLLPKKPAEPKKDEPMPEAKTEIKMVAKKVKDLKAGDKAVLFANKDTKHVRTQNLVMGDLRLDITVISVVSATGEALVSYDGPVKLSDCCLGDLSKVRNTQFFSITDSAPCEVAVEPKKDEPTVKVVKPAELDMTALKVGDWVSGINYNDVYKPCEGIVVAYGVDMKMPIIHVLTGKSEFSSSSYGLKSAEIAKTLQSLGLPDKQIAYLSHCHSVRQQEMKSKDIDLDTLKVGDWVKGATNAGRPVEGIVVATKAQCLSKSGIGMPVVALSTHLPKGFSANDFAARDTVKQSVEALGIAHSDFAYLQSCQEVRAQEVKPKEIDIKTLEVGDVVVGKRDGEVVDGTVVIPAKEDKSGMNCPVVCLPAGSIGGYSSIGFASETRDLINSRAKEMGLGERRYNYLKTCTEVKKAPPKELHKELDINALEPGDWVSGINYNGKEAVSGIVVVSSGQSKASSGCTMPIISVQEGEGIDRYLPGAFAASKLVAQSAANLGLPSYGFAYLQSCTAVRKQEMKPKPIDPKTLEIGDWVSGMSRYTGRPVEGIVILPASEASQREPIILIQSAPDNNELAHRYNDAKRLQASIEKLGLPSENPVCYVYNPTAVRKQEVKPVEKKPLALSDLAIGTRIKIALDNTDHLAPSKSKTVKEIEAAVLGKTNSGVYLAWKEGETSCCCSRGDTSLYEPVGGHLPLAGFVCFKHVETSRKVVFEVVALPPKEETKPEVKEEAIDIATLQAGDLVSGSRSGFKVDGVVLLAAGEHDATRPVVCLDEILGRDAGYTYIQFGGLTSAVAKRANELGLTDRRFNYITTVKKHEPKLITLAEAKPGDQVKLTDTGKQVEGTVIAQEDATITLVAWKEGEARLNGVALFDSDKAKFPTKGFKYRFGYLSSTKCEVIAHIELSMEDKPEKKTVLKDAKLGARVRIQVCGKPYDGTVVATKQNARTHKRVLVAWKKDGSEIAPPGTTGGRWATDVLNEVPTLYAEELPTALFDKRTAYAEDMACEILPDPPTKEETKMETKENALAKAKLGDRVKVKFDDGEFEANVLGIKREAYGVKQPECLLLGWKAGEKMPGCARGYFSGDDAFTAMLPHAPCDKLYCLDTRDLSGEIIQPKEKPMEKKTTLADAKLGDRVRITGFLESPATFEATMVGLHHSGGRVCCVAWKDGDKKPVDIGASASSYRQSSYKEALDISAFASAWNIPSHTPCEILTDAPKPISLTPFAMALGGIVGALFAAGAKHQAGVRVAEVVKEEPEELLEEEAPELEAGA